MNLYQTTFSDGTVLEYTKAAGSAAPLFVSTSTMDALGYANLTPGVLFSPSFQKYIVKQPLKRGGKPVLLVHLNGMLKLLSNRHPVWETEFLARFLTEGVPQEILSVSDRLQLEAQPPSVITPDKSHRSDLLKFGEQMEDVIRRLEALEQYHQPVTPPVSIPAPVTTSRAPHTMVRIPGTKKQISIPVAGTYSTPVGLTEAGVPVYVHVEGYRTVNEMLMYNGYQEFVGTNAGRGFSRRLKTLCDKNGIEAVKVLNAERLQHDPNRQRTCKINRDFHGFHAYAYPKEMWEIIEPAVIEKSNKHAKGV